MVAPINSHCVVHADLNQYTLMPRLDGVDLNFEYAYDADGNLRVIAEYPRAADITGDYVLDAGDLSAFTDAFNNNDPAGDFNGDGVYDQADLTGFVNAFSAGPSTYYNAHFTYDQWNQLVGFAANDGPTPIKKSRYRYDCFNRRVVSLVDSDGDGTDDEVTYFIYAGQAAWQLVEEYDGPASAASHLKSYVYGNYIDEVLQMRDHPSSEDCFYHQDDLFSVYAMTDEAGAVVERYEYGDYGQVSIMAGDRTSRAASLYGNRHTFTGRLLDDEMTLAGGEQTLQYRHRYMTTGNGRFLQRDQLHYADGPNLLVYAANLPLAYVEPRGLALQLPIAPPVPPLRYIPAPSPAPSPSPVPFKPGGQIVLVGLCAYLVGEAISPYIFPDIDPSLPPGPKRRQNDDNDCSRAQREKDAKCGSPPKHGRPSTPSPPTAIPGPNWGNPGDELWCSVLRERIRSANECFMARLRVRACFRRKGPGSSPYDHDGPIRKIKENIDRMKRFLKNNCSGQLSTVTAKRARIYE